MTSFLKKNLFLLAGFDDPALLPPKEYLITTEEQDDCSTCLDPCTDHKQFPSNLYIDQTTPILGSVHPYGRHVIIATGQANWASNIYRDKQTFAHSLYSSQPLISPKPWKNLITNSSLVSYYSTIPDACDVLIYPDNIIISNVTCEVAQDFYNLFLNTPLPTKEEPTDIELLLKDDRLGGMKIQKSPYKNMMLLCSHGRVDKRCGITAPILSNELDQILREKSLDEHDVGILMVSHIGGIHI